MGKLDSRLDNIFAQALEIADANERTAFVERACGGDATLRQEVESLLQADQGAGNFMKATRVVGPANLIPSEQAGDRIGRYKLLEQIGEGGFGVVWMAEQEEPVRRRVALKIIKLGMDTKEVVARFEAERQALAMMDHPNIAIVFDGGATATGRPYFVMELVKGIPITDYCDASKLSTHERLALFMQVCEAVQHAHQKGVIHRDLKPSNILVTVKDDRPVPKVIDFGIAKATQARLTEKTLFTRLNQWIGTPAYMSPEQAGLGSLDVDTRSDIYSLGVLLYELLTGRTPFDPQKLLAAGYDAVMRTIREEDPPKPSTRLSTLAEEELSAVAANRGAEPAKLNRLVRGDLDWIVMKALEKDRTRRYETANDLALDLKRYFGNEPVSAMAPSAIYTWQKFIRRHLTGLATATALALILALGVGVSLWQTVRATRAEKRTSAALGLAEKAKLAAEQGQRETEAALYASRVSGASQAWEKGDVKEAEDLLDLCPEALRDWEWRYIKRQCHAELTSFSAVPPDNTGGPEAADPFADLDAQLAFLPDDSRLAVKMGSRAPAVFDLSTGKLVPLMWTPDTTSEVVLAVDGSRLVTLPKTDRAVQVLDLNTWKTSFIQVESASSARVVNDEASWLALGSSNGVVVVGLAQDTVRRFIDTTNRLRPETLSPDGATLVTSSDKSDESFQVWDTVNGKMRFAIASPGPHKFHFDQRGRRLVLLGRLDDYDSFGEAVWDVARGQRLFMRRTQSLFGAKFCFARDGQWLILAHLGILDQYPSTDLIIIDATSGQEMCSFVADNAVQHADRIIISGAPQVGVQVLSLSGVKDVSVSPEAGLMALAVTDRTVHLISLPQTDQPWQTFDTRTPNLHVVLRGHRGAVLAVAFSRDGKRLASIDRRGVVKVWEPGRSLAIKLGEDWQQHASVSKDTTLVVGNERNGSYALNLTTGARKTLPPFPNFGDHRDVRVLDEARFSVGGQVWSVPSGGPIMTFSTNMHIGDVASTEDERYVATIGGEGRVAEVRLWDTLTGKLVGKPIPIRSQGFAGPYPYHQGSANLSLTSDGKKLAVCAGGETNLVQVWRTGVTGDTPGQITSFPGRQPVLFGPNGAWLLTGKTAGVFQRVDATTGKVFRDYSLRSKFGNRFSEDQFSFSPLGWEISPDGRFAVCFGVPTDLPVMDLFSGEVIFEGGYHTLPEWGSAWAAFTPDSRRLLIPGRDQCLGIWSLETKS